MTKDSERPTEMRERSEDAKRKALEHAARVGWADVAAGRVVDVSDEALEDFIAQLGLRAARQDGALTVGSLMRRAKGKT